MDFPIANLPEPDYIELIGREKEKEKLIYQLSKNFSFHLLSLRGMGGIGKSALALEVCRYYRNNYKSISRSDRFDYIIWTSAKIEDMTYDGRVQRRDSQTTLNEIIRIIAKVLNIPGAQTIDEDGLEAQIRIELSKSRVLLVIDSFELISNAEKVNDYFTRFPNTSKILVTSRPQQNIIGGFITDITGLQPAQGKELIKKLFNVRPGSQINEQQIDELLTLSEGIPLVIYWAVGRIRDLKEPYSSVTRKLQKGDADLSRYCVNDSIDFIKGTKTEEISHALLPLQGPIPKQRIAEIVGLGKEIKLRDKALEDLETLQIVTKNRREEYWLSSLAKAYLLENINTETVIESTRKWAEYYYKFVTSVVGIHGRVDSYNRHLQKIWSEFDNILGVLSALVKIDDDLFCNLLEAMRYLLYMRSDWITRNQFMSHGLEISKQKNDCCKIILFGSDIAWVEAYRGHMDKAEKHFASAENHFEGCKNPYYRAKYLVDRARYHHMLGVEDLAEYYYKSALENAKKTDEVPTILSTVYYYLGLLYYDIGNTGEALDYFTKGLNLAEKYNATREADRHRAFIALIKADLGKYKPAREIFDKIVPNAERNNDLVRKADYQFALARIEHAVNNSKEARLLLQSSEKIYEDLGRFRDRATVIEFRKSTNLT